MTQNDAMAAQLEKIGLKTSDIKYVAVGHMHLDHGGNVSQVPNATFVVQNDEMNAAWGPDVGYSPFRAGGVIQASRLCRSASASSR